jgi:hypothetical protein
VFRGAAGAAIAAVLTLLAFAPVALLAGAAIGFAGLPWRSAIPLMDWSIIALGAALALGAAAIIAVGYSRVARQARTEREVGAGELDAVRRQLRDAFERDHPEPPRYDSDGDIRVTRV